MNYSDLSEIRSNFKVNWYRSEINSDRFKELSQKNDLQGWIQAGGHLLLFSITGTTVYFAHSAQVWPLLPLALLAHGTIASFLKGAAPHELGHGTVFKKKWLNKFFLYLFSLLSWWNPFDYASSHTYHHRYTLHPKGDRENLLPLHPKVGKTFLLQLFTINLFTLPGRTFGKGGLISTIWVTTLDAMGKTGSNDIPSNEWLNALHKDQPNQHKKSIYWSRIQLAFHGSLVIISIVTGLWILTLIFTLSSFIGNWLSYFVALPQHCGLRENISDFRKSTRSIKLPRFVEFLYWHMNWHIEHHMYGGIPCYNLRDLHQELKADMPYPRTLIGAWQEMLYIWEKQKIDKSYQYDTPLPTTAKLTRSRRGNSEENSLGDLAPKGLN